MAAKVLNPQPTYSFSETPAQSAVAPATQRNPEYDFPDSDEYTDPAASQPDYYPQYVSIEESSSLCVVSPVPGESYVYALDDYRYARYFDEVVNIPKHLNPYLYLLDPEQESVQADITASDETYAYDVGPVFEPPSEPLKAYSKYAGRIDSYPIDTDPYPMYLFDTEIIGLTVIQSESDPDVYSIERYPIDKHAIIEDPIGSGLYTVDTLVEGPAMLYTPDGRLTEDLTDPELYDLEL